MRLDDGCKDIVVDGIVGGNVRHGKLCKRAEIHIVKVSGNKVRHLLIKVLNESNFSTLGDTDEVTVIGLPYDVVVLLDIVRKLGILFIVFPHQVVKDSQRNGGNGLSHDVSCDTLCALRLCFPDIADLLRSTTDRCRKERDCISVNCSGQVAGSREIRSHSRSIQHSHIDACALLAAGNVLSQSGHHFK